MPAKRKIQKEDILKASISIISHEGLNALNARKIAKKLGCSTQPLFYIYENMDVLKKDVIDEIVKIFDREVLKSETGQLEYKDIGINYIRFAKEEHELFKIMFNRKINEGAFDFIDLTGSAKTILETISKQTGMSNEDAKLFHLRMWLYVNGIASLAANQTVEFNDEEIIDLLKDQYVSMLLYEVKKGNVKEEILVQLTKEYKNLKAIDDLSFNVYQGEILGLLGPNGCGKSTTINSILSLLKYQEGFIKVFGKEMKPDSYDLKAKIGVIFQEVAVFDELNVYDNINYFCGLYIRDKKQRKQYVDDAINLVGLNDFKKFLPKQLSGGLLRRLNIACGIAHKPKLIFLDEPTVAVDPQSRNHILDGIKKLRDQGATIVYTTHYMEEVEILCDRIIILDKGKIIAQGTSDELKKEANIEEKIERVGPTLNDVMLKLTGKELRD